jgi:hypothetical protein
MEDSLNGWTNCATWNVNYWIMNDESFYRQWQQYTSPGGVHTSLTAHIIARDILGLVTPDGVHLDDPQINWEEIANLWNVMGRNYERLMSLAGQRCQDSER